MPITLTTPGALYAEHEALLAAEAAAWAEAERHLAGAPGHASAVERWSDANDALDAFNARLAGTLASDFALVELKARALLAMFHDRPGNLEFAITAALDKAGREDIVCDEALALSIARDVLAQPGT